MTQNRISLSTAADVLAAIPAILGFIPENSVVVIALASNTHGKHQIAATVRIDAHGAENAADQVAAALARQQVEDAPVDAVILAAIADTAHAGASLFGIDALRAAFSSLEIDTIFALHAYNLTAGTMFTDLDHLTDGVVPDTTTTTELATTRAVLEGTVIAGRREDIAARFNPGEEVPAVLAFSAAAAMGENFLPATFSELSATIAASEIPSTNLTARVGLMLATGHLEVRDAFMSMSTHGVRNAAEAFTHIAAALRGTARAQALTLAAIFYYSTGDGSTANMAIDAATDTATVSGTAIPSLTKLVTTALEYGAPPAVIDEMFAAITPEYVTEHIGTIRN